MWQFISTYLHLCGPYPGGVFVHWDFLRWGADNDLAHGLVPPWSQVWKVPGVLSLHQNKPKGPPGSSLFPASASFCLLSVLVQWVSVLWHGLALRTSSPVTAASIAIHAFPGLNLRHAWVLAQKFLAVSSVLLPAVDKQNQGLEFFLNRLCWGIIYIL